MASIGGPATSSHWLSAAWRSMVSAHTWWPFREVTAGTTGQLRSVTGSPGDLKGTLPRPPPRDAREHSPVTWHLPGFAAPGSSRGPLSSHASKQQANGFSSDPSDLIMPVCCYLAPGCTAGPSQPEAGPGVHACWPRVPAAERIAGSGGLGRNSILVHLYWTETVTETEVCLVLCTV